jgi:diketogulonate reductase-like aldo/keto reductase
LEKIEDEKVVILNNGQKMPRVQFGTYKIKGPVCLSAVLSALR